MGASGFYRRFIPNYSTIASPFYRMTTKSAPDKPKWSQDQIRAFEELKKALTSNSVLTSPDPEKDYILCTDASTRGIGAVLCQLDAEGQEKPLAYFSRKLKRHQLNYTITKLELLAVVAAIEHFQIYLTGSKFSVYRPQSLDVH